VASELGRTLEAPWPGLEEIVAFLLQVHHLLSQPDLYLWLEVSTSQGDESGDRSCYASNLISIKNQVVHGSHLSFCHKEPARRK
jgi:hypothetical protein